MAVFIPKAVKTPIGLSVICTILTTLLVSISFFRLQPVVPLFYSLAETSDYLAAKYWLFLFPVFAGVTLVLHLLIVQTLRSYHKILLELFAWMTFLVQALCLLAVSRIIILIW